MTRILINILLFMAILIVAPVALYFLAILLSVVVGVLS